VKFTNYKIPRRIMSSGMLRRVALVRTDVTEDFTRATRRNIPEDNILHSHRREKLKSYIKFQICDLFFAVFHTVRRILYRLLQIFVNVCSFPED
jgi:hypothetical protein